METILRPIGSKQAGSVFLPEILQDYSDTLTLEDFNLEDLEKIDAMAMNEDPGFREQIRMIERFVHQKTQDSPSRTSSAN